MRRAITAHIARHSSLWEVQSLRSCIKMILHKLVILGDAGVGKTALAVQVSLFIISMRTIANLP